MIPGDRVGLVMLLDNSVWVGVQNNAGEFSVVMKSGLAMDANWNTINTGITNASVPIPHAPRKIWLQATADIHAGAE